MADYNAVPLVATGDWIDDAWLNTYIRDNLAALWLYSNGGDTVQALDANTLAKLAIGAANTIVKSTGSAQAYTTMAALLQLTALISGQAAGDFFYANAATTIARLAKPASGMGFLYQMSGGTPGYAAATTAYGIPRTNSGVTGGEIFTQCERTRASRSSNLASTSIAETAIALNAESDDGGWHSNTTNSERITPDNTGRYGCKASMKITNSSGVSIDSITLTIKTSTGVALGRSMAFYVPDGATVYLSTPGYIYDLTAGEYIVMATSRSNADTGVTINATETWLEVVRER